QVREVEGIGAGDLDLPLDADVPEGHALEQCPVLGDRISVVAGGVGVGVEAVHCGPVTPWGVGERGLAGAGVEEALGCGVGGSLCPHMAGSVPSGSLPAA